MNSKHFQNAICRVLHKRNNKTVPFAVKVNFSGNFRRSAKRSNDIASFVEHPVYSVFKIYSVLVLVFLF